MGKIDFQSLQNNNFEELLQLDLTQQNKHVKHYKQSVAVNIHHFYIVEDIGEVNYYLNMINILRTAEQHDTIFIYLNTNGGNLHTSIQIISAIRQSQATVITSLEGMVASAGTMIFLAGHKHIVNQNCTFMIHNYSQLVGGKGNEIVAQVKFTEVYFRKLADMIYGEFLTKEELDSVVQGKDLWMDSDEVASRVKDKLINLNSPDDVSDIISPLSEQLAVQKPADEVVQSKPKKSSKKPKKVD